MGWPLSKPGPLPGISSSWSGYQLFLFLGEGEGERKIGEREDTPGIEPHRLEHRRQKARRWPRPSCKTPSWCPTKEGPAAPLRRGEEPEGWVALRGTVSAHPQAVIRPPHFTCRQTLREPEHAPQAAAPPAPPQEGPLWQEDLAGTWFPRPGPHRHQPGGRGTGPSSLQGRRPACPRSQGPGGLPRAGGLAPSSLLCSLRGLFLDLLPAPNQPERTFHRRGGPAGAPSAGCGH